LNITACFSYDGITLPTKKSREEMQHLSETVRTCRLRHALRMPESMFALPRTGYQKLTEDQVADHRRLCRRILGLGLWYSNQLTGDRVTPLLWRIFNN